jgi:hypothetical protein
MARAGYARLLALFEEFRAVSKPPMLESGVPDYTSSSMATQFDALRSLQAELASLEPAQVSRPVLTVGMELLCKRVLYTCLSHMLSLVQCGFAVLGH